MRWCCNELMAYCGVFDTDASACREWECIECGRRISEEYDPTKPAKNGYSVLLDRISELEKALEVIAASGLTVKDAATIAMKALGGDA